MSCFICLDEGGTVYCGSPKCTQLVHAECLASYRQECRKMGADAICACTGYYDNQRRILAKTLRAAAFLYWAACVYSIVRSLIDRRILSLTCGLAECIVKAYWINPWCHYLKRLFYLWTDDHTKFSKIMVLATFIYLCIGDDWYRWLYEPEFTDFFWKLYYIGLKCMVSWWLSFKVVEK